MTYSKRRNGELSCGKVKFDTGCRGFDKDWGGWEGLHEHGYTVHSTA